MSKRKIATLGVCALFSGVVFSGTMGEIASQGPNNLYVGLGGGYNSVTVNNKLYAFGTSNTYANGSLTTYGSAGGYSTQLPNTVATFSPQAQLGYSQYFEGRKEYWGVKAIYQFLNAQAVTYNVPIAQYGAYVNAGTGLLQSSTFAGNVVAETAQVIANHQINLFALVGHSFNNFDLYLGAGPSVFGMQSKITNAFPFANIDGVSTSQSDYPISYSKTMWVWGGGAQLGMTYHIAPTWFLDFNYTAIGTAHNTVSNPFRAIGKKPVAGISSTGTLFANSSQSLSTQTFSITVNKTFNI